MQIKKIVILGGYGNFGKRIAESLADYVGITLIIAGRNIIKATAMCGRLIDTGKVANCIPVKLDIYDAEFETILKTMAPDLVIHTCGPFQGQDYRVAEICIRHGCHYIDLADDRRYVCDITCLDLKAKSKSLLFVSGASSVPGLSSTVVDHYSKQFLSIDSIELAIAPGNKVERGEATVRAILSYLGHSFKAYQNGEWKDIYGWLDSRSVDFGAPIGRRLLANVDVPDLELFPARYQGVRTVTFQAGLELSILHKSMVCMAGLSKIGMVKNWLPLSSRIYKLSQLFVNHGTDVGGMKVIIKGQDLNLKEKTVIWTLYAENGVGPYIPTLSTIILTKKFINNEIQILGAMPCIGMYSLNEFTNWAKQWNIYFREEVKSG